MNVSELLRALADKLDGIGQDAEHSKPEAQQAELTPVEVDNTDHSEDSVFVPPLQQKLELLKKATGVESVYDDEGAIEDEMSIMKRNAGISPVVLQITSDDEPLDM